MDVFILVAIVVGVGGYIFGAAYFDIEHDMKYHGWFWPYPVFQLITGRGPLHKRTKQLQQAYDDGRSGMRYYGSLENPSKGRCEKKYLNTDDTELFDAYIRGGNDYLDKLVKESAGLSLAQVRLDSLKKADQQRLQYLETLKELRTEVLTTDSDKWNKEFGK